MIMECPHLPFLRVPWLEVLKKPNETQFYKCSRFYFSQRSFYGTKQLLEKGYAGGGQGSVGCQVSQI